MSAEPTQYLHGATTLHLRSIRYLIPFLRQTRKIERAMAGMQGLVGYALRPKFLQLRFETCTAWENHAALGRFMALPEHQEAMRQFHIWSADDSKTVNWTSQRSELDWSEAESRLKKAAPAPVKR